MSSDCEHKCDLNEHNNRTVSYKQLESRCALLLYRILNGLEIDTHLRNSRKNGENKI